MLTAAHDLSDGGLAMALAEMAMASGLGATIDQPTDNPVASFFGEDQGRYVVTAEADALAGITSRAAAAGVAVAQLGQTGGDQLKLGSARAISIKALIDAHQGWFPAFMQG